MGLAGFADGHANLMRDQVDAYELLSNGWEAARRRARPRAHRPLPASPTRRRSCSCRRSSCATASATSICGTATEGAFAEAEPAFREVLDGLRFAAPGAAEPGALQVLRG